MHTILGVTPIRFLERKHSCLDFCIITKKCMQQASTKGSCVLIPLKFSGQGVGGGGGGAICFCWPLFGLANEKGLGTPLYQTSGTSATSGSKSQES